MKSHLITLLAGCVAAPALFGQSIWGVEAGGLVANKDDDGALTERLEGSGSGGAGWHSDYTSGGDGRGSFLSAGTVLSDPGQFLSLSTFAATSSQEDSTASIEASIFAIESFAYAGSINRPITLAVDLDGTFTNSVLNPSFEAGNFATISILRGGAAVDPVFAYSNELIDWLESGYELIDSISLEQSEVQTLQSASIGLIANPGDTFHIFAQAFSRMLGPDGVADASSTLTVGWVGDVGGLSSLSGAGDLILIPEPQAFAIWIGTFAGLALTYRRRR